jgi:hypothetical protein
MKPSIQHWKMKRVHLQKILLEIHHFKDMIFNVTYYIPPDQQYPL